MSKLIQWRPGCFARNGDECTIAGRLHRMRGGDWWWICSESEAGGVFSTDVDPYLKTFPLPPPEKPRTTGPVDFRGDH